MAFSINSTGRLYVHELHGNTLVIRPRGDSVGFSVGQRRQENGEIRKLVEDSRVQNLLVDLSTEHYFGSMVIGELLEFGQLVKARGGRIGLCQASDDLLVVLNLMQLNGQWEFFPTTAAAVQTVARIPWSQRFWRYRQAVVAMVALGLLCASIWFWPRNDRGMVFAEQVVLLWEKYERQRETTTSEELHLLNGEVKEQLQPIVTELLQTSRRRPLQPAERTVLFTARPWLKAMDAQGAELNSYLRDTRLSISQMRVMLGRANGPSSTLSVDLATEGRNEDEPPSIE